MSCLKLYLSNVPLLAFIFYGLTALVGLGLLIFEALWSHSGVNYTWLLYMLVACQFTSSL